MENKLIIDNENLKSEILKPIILNSDINEKNIGEFKGFTKLVELIPNKNDSISGYNEMNGGELKEKDTKSKNYGTEKQQENSKNFVKRRQKVFIENVFEKALLTRSITTKIIHIGKNFRETLESILKNDIEGKCIVEGYIKTNSVSLVNYSSGIIRGENIIFEVVFNCEICYPVEGMNISCQVKNVTKAGIRAESIIDNPSPFVLFISRDHHYNNTYFNSIKVDDKIKARIIGQRFELNDNFISLIGEIIQPKNENL